ncbi:MAG: DUF6580 family putative transport protein [Gammaproteobacteria bacterium]
MNRYLLAILLVAGVAAQLAPHPFNVSPVAAIGLFAGALLRPRVAWLVPVAAMAISQFTTDFYPLPVLICVLTGMLAGPILGRLCLSRQQSVTRFTGATLGAALSFYLISNFGIWLAGYYPATWAGLVDCYLMGLPFLGRSLIGDLVYGAILFGAWALAVEFRNNRGSGRFA